MTCSFALLQRCGTDFGRVGLVRLGTNTVGINEGFGWICSGFDREVSDMMCSCPSEGGMSGVWILWSDG